MDRQTRRQPKNIMPPALWSGRRHNKNEIRGTMIYLCFSSKFLMEFPQNFHICWSIIVQNRSVNMTVYHGTCFMAYISILLKQNKIWYINKLRSSGFPGTLHVDSMTKHFEHCLLPHQICIYDASPYMMQYAT